MAQFMISCFKSSRDVDDLMLQTTMIASLRQSLADADNSSVSSSAGIFYSVMNASVTLHSLNIVVHTTTAQPTTATSSVTSNNTVDQSLPTVVTQSLPTVVTAVSTLGYDNTTVTATTALYDANMTALRSTSASYNATLTTFDNITDRLTSVTTTTTLTTLTSTPGSGPPSPQSHDNRTDDTIITGATTMNTSITI